MADYLGYERAFKAFNINYTVEPGAYQRGHGDIKEVRFIVIHHTASANNDAAGINPVRDGVSGLAGPLSQLCLKRNGDPHLIAVGVCWHAFGEINYRGVPAGQGNYYSIGIEGIDGGYNTWTDAQRNNYPRVVAALLKDMNLPSDAFIFHREYQPKSKIDPGGFTRDWFQSEVNKHYNSGGLPPAPVKSAIQGKRDENPWLGNKIIPEEEWTTPDGVGKFAHYENGSIYFTVATGAQSLNKEILDKWASQGYETGFLKYPINSTHDLDDTGKRRAQAFQGGSIYWSEANGAHFVGGAIGSKWAETNWEKGFLGMPVTDEIVLPDKVGILQAFEGGHIYFHPDTGAHTISGAIWDRFAKENYENIVGYPKTDSVNLPVRPGVFQIFTNGHIYEHVGKAYFVSRDFMYFYERLGYEAGRLGMVISNKELLGDDRWIQHFEGGSIEIDRKNKKSIITVNGEVVPV